MSSFYYKSIQTSYFNNDSKFLKGKFYIFYSNVYFSESNIPGLNLFAICNHGYFLNPKYLTKIDNYYTFFNNTISY